MNGSGTPVKGISPEMAAILIKVWIAITETNPTIISLANWPADFFAIIKPFTKNTPKIPIKEAVPINPSSSEITAKIESLIGSGKRLNLAVDCPNPTPQNPPEPMDIND